MYGVRTKYLLSFSTLYYFGFAARAATMTLRSDDESPNASTNQIVQVQESVDLCVRLDISRCEFDAGSNVTQ